jgi:hypothetical protein
MNHRFIFCVILILLSCVVGLNAFKKNAKRGKGKIGKGAKKSNAIPINAISSPNSSWSTKGKIMFLHFHKSGGSSMCKSFEYANRTYARGTNCNCHKLLVGGMTRQLIEQRFWRFDACAIETTRSWPGPRGFMEFANLFQGSLLTMLRDPWTRFMSNYYMDYSVCLRNKRCTDKTMTPEGLYKRKTVSSHYISTYGKTHLPNYFVRFLNGIGGAASGATHHHLEVAKTVLKKFHHVLFIEQDPSQRDTLLGEVLGVGNFTLPHDHSSAGRRVYNYAQFDPNSARNAQLRELYISDNYLDYELYNWAADYFGARIIKK